MNTSLLNVLKQIIANYGIVILNDARRVKALLSDLATNERRPQKNALIACLDQGFAGMLQNVPANERAAAKTKLAERLNREEGLDPALCADTLDLLEAALFGEGGKIQTNSTCRNCGKELQAEWKACPYCGTAALELSAGSGRNAAGGWQTAGTSTSGNTPNNAEAYNDRGNAYYNKGEYDRAIADLNEAIRLDPNFVWAYNNRGNAYNNKGDIDRAIADYSEAMRLDPNYAWAYASRGLAYKNKSPKNQAIQDWEKAIQLDPNYQWAKDRLKEIRGW